MDASQFAANTLQLLQADPKNYRKFGIYWYLVKALLKRYYTRDNLYLLGDYVDEAVTDRIPEGISLDDALLTALEEYQRNHAFQLGENPVDPDGDQFVLLDPDAGM